MKVHRKTLLQLRSDLVIVNEKGEGRYRRHLRCRRCIRRHRLSVNNALHGRKNLFPGLGMNSPDIEFQVRAAGNHVLRVAGVDRGDGHDG